MRFLMAPALSLQGVVLQILSQAGSSSICLLTNPQPSGAPPYVSLDTEPGCPSPPKYFSHPPSLLPGIDGAAASGVAAGAAGGCCWLELTSGSALTEGDAAASPPGADCRAGGGVSSVARVSSCPGSCRADSGMLMAFPMAVALELVAGTCRVAEGTPPAVPRAGEARAPLGGL